MEKLTKQEEEVMQFIWQTDSCTVKDVLTLMPEPQPPYTTVASVFNNLKRKHYVSQQRSGNTYVYTPAIRQNDYKRRMMAWFVHDYFSNSYKDMVTFFARNEKISPEDLQDIINEIEKEP
ncbi:MAG: BlaI/MecI/CopY family transcriptional regulator [Prevotella sp.]|nr:BlaI/MecI/CopY family transcriptional regulator [Prevotella sp.]MDY4039146.1 BlaI/MecI/CopY family transcriptional regulator [Prevotella sp.]